MTKYDSFELFARAVKDELESNHDCDVKLDEMMLEQTNNTQVGFQRDDLYRFMLLLPTDEEWVPSKLYAYLPTGIDQIADRPGVPVVEIDSIEVEAVLEEVDKKAPEYTGEFKYED